MLKEKLGDRPYCKQNVVKCQCATHCYFQNIIDFNCVMRLLNSVTLTVMEI